MLLDNNTKKVINLINNFNTRDIIILLKEFLSNLNSNYGKNIVNFSRYKHLLIYDYCYALFELTTSIIIV